MARRETKTRAVRRSEPSAKTWEIPPFVKAFLAHWTYEPQRRSWQIKVWVAAAVFLGLVIAHRVFLSASAPGFDDSFITYRFAYNNAHGHWFQWNVGEPPVYGTTTFLYTMLLTAAEFFGIYILVASIVLSVLAQTAAALFAFLLVRQWCDDLAAFVVGILIAADGFGITATLGMETYVYIALLLGSLWCYQTERFSWAAALAALLGITRIDGFLLAAVLAGHYVLVRKTIPWKPLIAFAAVVLPWAVTCIHFFGSLLPHTFGVKQIHSKIGFSGVYSLWNTSKQLGIVPWIVLALTALFGWLHTLRLWRRSAIALLSAFLVLNAAAYYVVKLPDFPWYYAPTVAGAWLLAGVGAFYLTKRIRVTATAILCALALFVNVRLFLRDPFGVKAGSSIYIQAAQWLWTNAKGGESVVAMEVGAIGFYNPQLTVHDLIGLESPSVMPALVDHRVVESVAGWNPVYIFLAEGPFYTLPIFHPILYAKQCASWLSVRDPNWLEKWNHWFENRYELVQTWPIGKHWWDQSPALYVLARRKTES
jgi:hypothetical protein